MVLYVCMWSYLLSTSYCYNMQWLTYKLNFIWVFSMLHKYLMYAHIIHELWCCLLLCIILLSSSCNISKVDKTLILSIPATYNLSIQSFVTFAAFIKLNIYHMYLRTVYINSYSHIVPSSEAQYSLTLAM